MTHTLSDPQQAPGTDVSNNSAAAHAVRTCALQTAAALLARSCMNLNLNVNMKMERVCVNVHLHAGAHATWLAAHSQGACLAAETGRQHTSPKKNTSSAADAAQCHCNDYTVRLIANCLPCSAVIGSKPTPQYPLDPSAKQGRRGAETHESLMPCS